MKEVVSIKTDGTDVFVESNVDGVWNLTQILAELEIIKIGILGEYFKRGNTEK